MNYKITEYEYLLKKEITGNEVCFSFNDLSDIIYNELPIIEDFKTNFKILIEDENHHNKCVYLGALIDWIKKKGKE